MINSSQSQGSQPCSSPLAARKSESQYYPESLCGNPWQAHPHLSLNLFFYPEYYQSLEPGVVIPVTGIRDRYPGHLLIGTPLPPSRALFIISLFRFVSNIRDNVVYMTFPLYKFLIMSAKKYRD